MSDSAPTRRIFREWVERAEKDLPPRNARPFRAILIGDFNAEWNPNIIFAYNAYEQVTNKFRDAWAIWARNQKPPVKDRAGYTVPSGKPYKRVDYIFLRKSSGINVVRAVRPRTGHASDHYPVLAVLSFN